MMISVDISSIPLYLQGGEFYRSLLCDDVDDKIVVPENVVKQDMKVESAEDLVNLLNSLRYWVVQDVPDEVFHYFLIQNAPAVQLTSICTDFEVQFPILCQLGKVLSVEGSDTLARFEAAIDVNAVALVKYLHSECMCQQLDSIWCLVAAKAGACDCLRYFHDQGCAVNEHNCCEVAATNGFIDCLIYLHSVGAKWDSRVSKAAATNGHLSCLHFAVEHGCPMHTRSTAYAAFGGHLECLEYLVARGEEVNKDTAVAAAGTGHRHVLQYLCSIGCHWDASVTARAAVTGQLACLTYLHESDCSWDFRTCHSAAYTGNLACLQYAHQHGCELNSNTTVCAVGHLECLQYLYEQHCPWHEGVCLATIHRNDPQSALFVVQHGAPHTFEFYAGVEDAGWSDVLELLHEQGYPDRYDD